MSDENANAANGGGVDLSGIGSFDFTPAWAKRDPSKGVERYASFDEGDRRRGGAGRGDAGRGERGPRRDAAPAGDFRDGARANFPRRDRNGEGRGGFRPFRERVQPLDAEIRILPDPSKLGPLMRKIQKECCAYPLKQLAYFFLDNPAACQIKVKPRGKDGTPAPKFHVCKACGFASLDEAALREHLLSAHLKDYFDEVTLDVEPPKGVFNCVAKCGLTGELLGPPNLHGFDARVREMVRTRFPGMSEAEYRARIEMVRDAETVETWRASSVKKTVYRAKGAGETAPDLDRERAENEFLRNFAPTLSDTSASADFSADAAMNAEDRALRYAVRDELARERRFPASLFRALRGAFGHWKFAFFRANDPRGPEFVTAVKPSALDREHAISMLVDTVKVLDEIPLATVAAFTDEQRKNLSWLVEKGHLVRYFNGLIVAPCAHPKFAPSPKLAKARAATPVAATEAAPAEPTPAAAEAVPSGAAEALAVPESEEEPKKEDEQK